MSTNLRLISFSALEPLFGIPYLYSQNPIKLGTKWKLLFFIISSDVPGCPWNEIWTKIDQNNKLDSRENVTVTLQLQKRIFFETLQIWFSQPFMHTITFLLLIYQMSFRAVSLSKLQLCFLAYLRQFKSKSHLQGHPRKVENKSFYLTPSLMQF